MQVDKQEPSLSPLADQVTSKPEVRQSTSNGASWIFWLALPSAFATALWWSHTQLQAEVKQLRQQLLAARDSFVRVSEKADDRLVALSEQMAAMGQLDARSLAAVRSLQELQQLVVGEQQQSAELQQQLTTARSGLDALTRQLQSGEAQQQLEREQDLEFLQALQKRQQQLGQIQLELQQASSAANKQQVEQLLVVQELQSSQAEQQAFMQVLQNSQAAQLDSLTAQLQALDERLGAGEQSTRQLLARLDQLQAGQLSKAELDELQQELTAFRAQTLRIQRGLQQRLDGLEQR